MGNQTTKENDITNKRTISNISKQEEEEEEEEENNNIESQEEEEEQINKISGKLLLKNCKIWKWNNDGISLTNNDNNDNNKNSNREISGEIISLPFIAVDYYGRLININYNNYYQKNQNNKNNNNNNNNYNINEELFDKVIDVSNQIILPGLMDSHIHVMSTGESSYYLDLKDCNSIEELKSTLKKHSDNNPQLPWIIGVNWDQVRNIFSLLIFSLIIIIII